MKSKIMNFAVALSILFMSQLITSKKSEAAIGLLMGKKTAVTVGGISTGTVAVSLVLTQAGAFTFSLGGAVLYALGVYVFGGLGLIILDDDKLADIEFQKVKGDELNDKFDSEAIAIYNDEIEQLNAIRKTMQSELTDDSSLEESKNLWSQYSSYLSPETIEIAGEMADRFVSRIRVK